MLCTVVRVMASVGLSAEMSKTGALPPPNVKTPQMHFLQITKQELLEFVLLFYEERYLQSLRLILFSLNNDSRNTLTC